MPKIEARSGATVPTVHVLAYGAVAGSTTIGASALAQARTDSGQAWLTATDTLDLLAFYKAQVALDLLGGGTLVFPNVGRDYQFSNAGFVHSNIDIDLDGSNVRMTGDGTLFTRSDRCFLFGILAREDYKRFVDQGWNFTCANITAGAATVTGVSGGAWAAGDVVLIRSTGQVGTTDANIPMPDVATFNTVKSYAAGTLVFDHPVEQAVTSPLLLNYSAITTLKSALVASGEPHRYYCCANSSLRNGKVIGLNSNAVEYNAAHDIVIDIENDSPRGLLAYGNGLVRSYVRIRGRWGGVKAPIEVATASALSTIDVDAQWSGETYNPGALTETNYDMIKCGENAFDCHVIARLRGYTKTYAFGLRAGGSKCQYDIDIESEGIQSGGVVFIQDATGGDQIVRGRIESSSCAYHADFHGVRDTLDGVVFSGVPTTNALRFRDASNGWAKGCIFPSGRPVFTGTSGNRLTGGYIDLPPTAWGTNQIQTLTSGGLFPWTTQTLYKTAETQVVNNSAVKVNDDTLFFPIAANEIWVGEFVLFVVGDATADFKFGIVVPSGVSALRYASMGDRSADTVVVGGPLATASDTSIVAHGADATGVVIVCKFYVANGSTAGTVQLDWAQNTAVAANTTVKIGSHVNYRRVA